MSAFKSKLISQSRFRCLSQFNLRTSLKTLCWHFGYTIVVLLVMSLPQDDTIIVIFIGIIWLVKLVSIFVTSIKMFFLGAQRNMLKHSALMKGTSCLKFLLNNLT